jgi:hypothetical protein
MAVLSVGLLGVILAITGAAIGITSAIDGLRDELRAIRKNFDAPIDE